MDYDTLLRERILTRQQANAEIGFRKEVLVKCSKDILYWFNNFAWTLDPRRTPSQLPFIPYSGKQEYYIRWLNELIKNPHDAFVDKPRDVGATAMTMNVFLYNWLFNPSFNARVGSRKEEYVDVSGSPDTLFYKLDYTLTRLPSWMLPDSWDAKRNRSHMRLTRPDNSNTIIGESANPNFARGGRQSIVFFDEIGFWSYAKSAWESAGDVTNLRLAMTTPPDSGRSSFAFKLLSGQAGTVERFEFEHTDIPNKDAEWIKGQKERRSKDEFDREILKSYTGSTRSKVYAAEWHLHAKVGDYPYNPNLPLYISWDFGFNDPTSMIWFQKDHSTNNVYVIDCYEHNLKTIDFFVPFVTGVPISGIHEYSEEGLEKIRKHADWRKDVTHFGDPSGKSKTQHSAISLIQQLRKHGIYVQSKPAKIHKAYWEKTILLIRRLHVDQTRCEHLIDMVLGARYPERSEGSQATTPVDKPIHDETSHMRTALEFFADNEPFLKASNKIEGVKEKKNVYKPMGGYD